MGAEVIEDDGEPFEEKMERLVSELKIHLDKSKETDNAISVSLRCLGYGL